MVIFIREKLPVDPELLVHVAERLGGRQADEQVGALLPPGQHSHPTIPIGIHQSINRFQFKFHWNNRSFN